MQVFESSQGDVLNERPHPASATQNSEVQGLPSSAQASGPPDTQVPELQRSAVVHAFSSLHGLVSSFEAAHAPVEGTQVSSVQALPSLQTRGVPGRQAPVGSQTSSSVQALASSQGHRSPVKGFGPAYEQNPNPPSPTPASTLQN